MSEVVTQEPVGPWGDASPETHLQVLLDQAEELDPGFHLVQLPFQLGQYGLHLGAWGRESQCSGSKITMVRMDEFRV